MYKTRYMYISITVLETFDTGIGVGNSRVPFLGKLLTDKVT